MCGCACQDDVDITDYGQSLWTTCVWPQGPYYGERLGRPHALGIWSCGIDDLRWQTTSGSSTCFYSPVEIVNKVGCFQTGGSQTAWYINEASTRCEWKGRIQRWAYLTNNRLPPVWFPAQQSVSRSPGETPMRSKYPWACRLISHRRGQ